MILREKLIALREKTGLSQLAVANELGVSRQAVSRWESGASAPSRENLRALANLYHVSLDWLCDESNHALDQEASETEADIDDMQKPESASLHPVHAQERTTEQLVQKKRHIVFLMIAVAMILSFALVVFFSSCYGHAKTQEIPIDDLSEDKIVIPTEREFCIQW